MELSGNVVLVTGGATGIGFALAERFMQLGNKVMVCGRREHKLYEAAERLPGLSVMRCDLAKTEDRESLVEAALDIGVNMLVNNAGVQRGIDLKEGLDGLLSGRDEIEINFRAHVHLSAAFIPSFMEARNPAIVNISSGLALVPLARFPVYCATKAAMHSFSMSMRQQLSDTRIKVFEALPPTVHDTELKGAPIEKSAWSVSAREVADAVIDGMGRDRYEIAIGSAAKWMDAPKEEKDQIFRDMNR